MAHALVKIFIHFVWSTKGCEPLLSNENRETVKNHLKEYAGENSINVTSIAVRPEHVHLVSSLSRSQRIEDVMKLVKGESSHWVNQNGLIRSRFSWQTGYWAGSVCY